MKNLILFTLHVLVCMTFSCSLKNDAEKDNGNNFSAPNHFKKEVVIFVYHRFGNPKYPSTNISLKDFESQLNYLKSNKFTVLTFGDAVNYINNSDQAYVEKVACITVDDGYKTFKSNALPLLIKYGFNASLFINSESVGGGTFMSWEELKEVHEQGIEIGNHSHSHAYFLNAAQNKRIKLFKEDLEKCQEEINAHLGFYPEIFAYPYGEYDLAMKGLLSDIGFKAAAAQNSGVMYNKQDNYAVPRFPMAGPYTKLAAFIEKANMKALRVKHNGQLSSIIKDENPPILTVEFDSSGADLTRYSCFTPGECKSNLEGNSITLKATEKLKGRRTLYKITAPAKNGKAWYWFSHLWIQPDINE